jgi:hypothetical protein
MRHAGRVLLCAVLALTVAGCFKRPVEEKVFDKDRTTIKLRSHKRLGTVVEKGYQHPFTISAVRAAHILSRLDVRTKVDGEQKRIVAIPLESLYLIGEGLAEALEEANENQEVVVMSIRRAKRLGIFDRKYLTSFVAYRKDGFLFLHLGVLDWEIEPVREDRLPVPQVGDPSSKYQVVPSTAMQLVDSGSVAVAWNDPIFAKPTRTRVTPGGRVVRRTILMETAEEELDPAASQQPAALPADLSPETLRKLADLEDARRRGDVSEGEYRLERNRILELDSSER